MLLHALVGPLLDPLASPSPIVELAGPTSSGKTAAALFAWSVVGDPADDPPSWSGTSVGRDLLCAAHCDRLLVIDDTAAARVRRGATDVQASIYRIRSGTEDAKATRSGDLRQAREWKVAALITGEHAAADHGHAAGAAARVLSIVEPPWVDVSPGTRRVIGDTLAALHDCHGHALREVVEWIVADYDARVAEIRAEYDRIRGISAAGPSGRAVDTVALLGAAARAARRSGAMPWQPAIDSDRDVWRILTDAIVDTAEAADVPARAWARIMAAIERQPHRVYTGASPPSDTPAGGWLARRRGVQIDVYSDALDDELARGGYSPGIVAEWADRRWIMAPETGRYRRSRRIAGRRERVVTLIDEPHTDDRADTEREPGDDDPDTRGYVPGEGGRR